MLLRWIGIAAVAALLSGCATTAAEAPLSAPAYEPVASSAPRTRAEEPSDRILFDPAKIIRDSRFGAIAAFQRALARAARSCEIRIPTGSVLSFADGVYGGHTANLLMAVSTRCERYRALAHTPAGERGAITVQAWTALHPGQTYPRPLERALMLSHATEGTDYTDVEFNLGTRDHGILTWGPMGATAGQGREVQRILNEINRTRPMIIDLAFGHEAPALRRFMATDKRKETVPHVQAVMDNLSRRTAWTHGFAAIGAQPDGRTIYDNLMIYDRSGYMQGFLRNFFRSYWAACWHPTNTDLGFFVDRAIHMGPDQARTDLWVDYVQAAERASGRTFTPAERRRAIAASAVAPDAGSRGDRLARDVIYYIDYFSGPRRNLLTNQSLHQLHQAGMSNADLILIRDEVQIWNDRTGMRASYLGLTDDVRAEPPFGLTAPAFTNCPASPAGSQ